MPELPEVEAARQIAEDHFVGKTIVQVNAVEDEKIFAGASSESLRSALVGKKVTAARRHGKNLWLELEQGGGGGGSSSDKGKKGKAAPKASSPPPSSSSSSPSSAALMLHFGMTGSFPVRGAKRVAYVNEGGGARKAEEEEGEQGEGAAAGASASPPRPQWPPRFCKIELSLSPGDVRVAFCDPRRFGRVQLVRPASAVAARLPAGRDVLNDPLSPRDLAEALGKVNKGKAGRALKTVLMEQSFLAGVGNWVADEVLFAARIHPEARSGQLSPSQIERLSVSLRSVAETACAAGADPALFPKEWIFHQRWDEKGAHKKKTHGGHGISWIKVGGRTTAFCPGVQKKADDGDGDGGGEEEEEATEEEEEGTRPAPKAAAAEATTTARKRKQTPPPPPPPKAAALPAPRKAAKRATGAVAVPKAPPSRAAPAARSRAPPRI